jgi:hypothetical protein
VSDQTSGKLVLEMIGESVLLVQVNLREVSCVRSVSGEVNLREIGQ